MRVDFLYTTAVVYIRVSGAIKPTDSFGLSVEFFSLCGFETCQIKWINPED